MLLIKHLTGRTGENDLFCCAQWQVRIMDLEAVTHQAERQNMYNDTQTFFFFFFKDDNYITAVLIHIFKGPLGYNCCRQCEDCFRKVSTRLGNNLHPSVRREEFVKGSIYHLCKLKHEVHLLSPCWIYLCCIHSDRDVFICRYLTCWNLMTVLARMINV